MIDVLLMFALFKERFVVSTPQQIKVDGHLVQYKDFNSMIK